MKNVAYLMESEEEAKRLLLKGDRASTYDQLVMTGLPQIPTKKPQVVDAGSGAGFVASIMKEILTQHRPQSELTLLDASDSRLKAAREYLGAPGTLKLNFIRCDLAEIPLADNSADYVFSRFVFEYLQEPLATFNELLRITKPGGKLVIGDLDYNCLNHFPLAEGLEKNLNWLVNLLREKKLLDPYIGRKLYSMFFKAGLRDIKVDLVAHHLFYGPLRKEDAFNWEEKINRLIQLSQSEKLSVPFDLFDFKRRFMEFLAAPERFTYTPLIIVQGTKP